MIGVLVVVWNVFSVSSPVHNCFVLCRIDARRFDVLFLPANPPVRIVLRRFDVHRVDVLFSCRSACEDCCLRRFDVHRFDVLFLPANPPVRIVVYVMLRNYFYVFCLRLRLFGYTVLCVSTLSLLYVCVCVPYPVFPFLNTAK